MLDNGLDKGIFLFWTPVLALFDVEILDVKLTVHATDFSLTKILAHLDNVLLLLSSHVIISGLPLFLLDIHSGSLSALLGLLHLRLNIG